MQRTQLPAAVSALLVEIVGSAAHPLAPDMAEWLGTSKRFRAFAEAYRDKIRKKARSARDPEGLHDLRCELAVAYLLVQEPRFTVQYEPQGVGGQRAPDFTVLYKGHLPFHLEVTRQRARPRDASNAPVPAAPNGEDARLAGTVCEKLGQMQPGAINVLALLADGEPYQEADVVATTRALLRRASNKEEAYFTRHGFGDSRDFLHRYQRLSGLLLITGWQHGPDTRTLLWENNQARHPIPAAILAILRRMANAPPNSP